MWIPVLARVLTAGTLVVHTILLAIDTWVIALFSHLTQTNCISSQFNNNLGINIAKEIESSTMRLANIWTYAFATLAAADRNPQDCASIIGSYEDVAYRYHAHSKNCATMSQADSIKSALHQAFQQLDADELPSSKCIKFDERGSWEGWVLYGRSGEVKLTQYCGPRIGYGKGESRGEL